MTHDQLDNGNSPDAPAARPARVRTVACLAGVSLERDVPPEELAELLSDPSNVVWLNVQDPGPEQLSMLQEEFGFHPLALEDVAKGHQRPKVDQYKGHLYVVAYGLRSGADVRKVQLGQVNLFVGRNYVVTVHREGMPALEDALGRWTRGGAQLREGVGFLVYTIMDALIDAYFPLIDAIEEQLEEKELEMFTRFRQSGIQEVLGVKRTLIVLRRVLYPLRDIFTAFLRREQPLFSPNTMVYFQDVQDHVLRILDVLDMEREMAASAVEAHLTVLSNRLNATMKTLTVITVCVALIGAVFGAWGMNFSPVPLGETHWGFYAIIGGTVGLIVAALGLAWWRGWL